jgi:hypothetical protein
MTTVETQTPLSQPTSAVPPQIAQHDAAALALEAAAVVAAAGLLHVEVQWVMSWAHGEWMRLFSVAAAVQSGAVFRAFLDEVAGRLTRIQVDPAPALLEYAQRARDLGVKQGFTEAGVPVRELPGRISLDTHAAVAKATRKAREKLDAAPRMVASVQRGSLSTVTRQLAPAVQARNIVDTAARTITNTELNAGIRQVADALGVQRVWIAESTACLDCLALSGEVVDVGDEFPMDATFDTKLLSYVPVSVGGLTGPPRHPRCRCRSSPWLGHVGPPGSVDLPTALRREAERSVLLGRRVPSESEGRRVRAADRLLHRIGTASPSGWQVPKSVKTRARTAVRKGKFTR